MAKQIIIKSYNSSGTYIGNINDATFDNFSKMINGGLSELILKLARTIDTFNATGDVTIGNKIEIWIIDEDTGNTAIKIYSGFVEQHNPIIDGDEHYVEIVCYSMVSKIKNDILKESAQTKLYTKATVGLTITALDLAAAEIADVVMAIIDKYNAVNTAFNLFYNLNGIDTVQDTGNDMQSIFEAMTYFEAIEKCRAAAPQNWHWILNANNEIEFKPISASADHTFVLSKDIKSIRASKTADGVKNILLLWSSNGGGAGTDVYKQYTDDASISLYGRRVEKQIDHSIYDEITMDNIGNSFINENKDPKIRIELEIADNNESDKGYNIESIEPGDTCKIVGLDVDGIVFGTNMIIKEVIYQLTSVRLIIETEKEFDMQKFVLDLSDNLLETKSEGIPPSYT